jgi:hypothetical protein
MSRIQFRRPISDARIPESTKLTEPVADSEGEHSAADLALLDWLGLATIGSQRLLVKDAIDPLLSNYALEVPTVSGSIAVATFTGLLHPLDIQRLYQKLYVSLPWRTEAHTRKTDAICTTASWILYSKRLRPTSSDYAHTFSPMRPSLVVDATHLPPPYPLHHYHHRKQKQQQQHYRQHSSYNAKKHEKDRRPGRGARNVNASPPRASTTTSAP